MKLHRGTGVLALAVASTFTALPAFAATPLEETAGVLLVCSSAPSAALARAERLRGAAEVAAADVLSNPALVATHQRAFTGPTDTETVIGISVPLGVSGRRSLLQDAARARRERADANAHATLFESALAFREAYVTAIVDKTRVDVATQQQASLMRLSATLQGLEKRGEAAGYDILRQDTQTKLHRRGLELLRARAARSRAVLATWTGAEVTLPEVPLGALAGGARANAGAGPLASARLRSLALEERAATLEARAARRRWVPDLEIFAGYRATELDTETGQGISLGLTIPLTFFDHGQGEAARADAAAAFAEAQGSVERREREAELRSSSTALSLLEPGVAEAEQVVLDAREVQARAEQLYGAGEASITELLEAFRSAEEAQLALIALREEIAHVRLAIMQARGSLLDPSLDKRCGATPAGEAP